MSTPKPTPARVAARTVEAMLYAWGWGAEVCPMCWGSHGCDLPKGHAGAHVCGNIWVVDGELVDDRCQVHDGQRAGDITEVLGDGAPVVVWGPEVELFTVEAATAVQGEWTTWDPPPQ